MIVEARCIVEAYDNQNARHYFPGFVHDYDTENEKLNVLVTVGGKWVFQYPGHEGGPAREDKVFKRIEAVDPDVKMKFKATPETVVERPLGKKANRPLSEAHKAAMIAGRARKKAEKLARVEAA